MTTAPTGRTSPSQDLARSLDFHAYMHAEDRLDVLKPIMILV